MLTRIFITLFFFCGTSWAQTVDYSYTTFKFDSTMHTARIIKTELKNFSVEVTIVRDTLLNECDIWLKEIFYNGKSKEKYLGQTNSESGFYIPMIQPLENCYLIAICSENNGNFIYLNEKGEWLEFPGYFFAISKDKKIIYTTTESDGENRISKVNLVKNEVITKSSIHAPKDEIWEGVASKDYYHPLITDWIH